MKKTILIPKTIQHGKWTLSSINQNNLREILWTSWTSRDFTISNPSQIDLICSWFSFQYFWLSGWLWRLVTTCHWHFLCNTNSTLYPCQIQDFRPDPHDIPVEEAHLQRNFWSSPSPPWASFFPVTTLSFITMASQLAVQLQVQLPCTSSSWAWSPQHHTMPEQTGAYSQTFVHISLQSTL